MLLLLLVLALWQQRRCRTLLRRRLSGLQHGPCPGAHQYGSHRRRQPTRRRARRRRWWRRVVLPVLRRRQLHAERTGMVDELRVARVTEPAMLRPRPVARDQPKPVTQPRWSGYEVELRAE